MTLAKELGLRRGFRVLEHETILNIYYTAAQVKKKATEFFRRYSLTDVQFNVMMLLVYQTDSGGGLTQAQLSDMMLVNRADITSLIDRMERDGLVVRTTTDHDRRSNLVKMTSKGKKLFRAVEPFYAQQVRQVISVVSTAEQKQLIESLETIRAGLSAAGKISWRQERKASPS
jgi:MarR family 2-MHQ and catechol resistance regulon transcriptional repressor